MSQGVRTRSLADEEYAVWREQQVTDYAEEMARNVGVAAATLMERSRREHDELLPRELGTPGHRMVIAEDAETGERIGWLWIAERDSDAGKVAWIYDIVVDETQRGKGYGRALMGEAESIAKEMGLSRVELNVFADNAVARSLYESSGYHEIARQMAKDL